MQDLEVTAVNSPIVTDIKDECTCKSLQVTGNPYHCTGLDYVIALYGEKFEGMC
jgi:hypothetical protein